ncbi:hypothetical protein SAMN02745866_02527 [Alteromonadaceae bacterium Bs31]|nr:hypothetical protein SAMN02745866_02527 [Alteromonadaceae bacterium Bs31]
MSLKPNLFQADRLRLSIATAANPNNSTNTPGKRNVYLVIVE